MQTHAVQARPAPAVDPVVQGLLGRLAGQGRDHFLPHVPDAELACVLGAYQRLACGGGFFQACAAPS
ncbi:hypothetical protein ACIRP3_00715 [Streptomyces sp. NPDC101209]|uniref:hypothetical protein n=1 Tax=Streptomyces sp. NPDC101209 TaxID=3366129 RepID=UPI0038182F84